MDGHAGKAQAEARLTRRQEVQDASGCGEQFHSKRVGRAAAAAARAH